MKTKPYVVLVGMDFSKHADRALAHGFELATRQQRAEVHVLCVIPSVSLGAHHALTGYCLTAEAGVRDGAFESLCAHVQLEFDAFLPAQCPHTFRNKSCHMSGSTHRRSESSRSLLRFRRI